MGTAVEEKGSGGKGRLFLQKDALIPSVLILRYSNWFSTFKSKENIDSKKVVDKHAHIHILLDLPTHWPPCAKKPLGHVPQS